MTATFLLEIEIDDISAIPDIAEEIHDDLQTNYSVLSVKPWARPTIPNATPQSPPQL